MLFDVGNSSRLSKPLTISCEGRDGVASFASTYPRIVLFPCYCDTCTSFTFYLCGSISSLHFFDIGNMNQFNEEERRRHDKSWNDPPIFSYDQLNNATTSGHTRVPLHKRYH